MLNRLEENVNKLLLLNLNISNFLLDENVTNFLLDENVSNFYFRPKCQ